MNVHDALAQIAEIRQRMAWTATFRGYRASTTAVTGVIAIAAGALQGWTQPAGEFSVHYYLAVWFSAAIAGTFIVATGFLLRRGEYSNGHVAGALTIAAVEAFLPCLVAGALITYALVFFQSFTAISLLPGLWMILFSLGIFASRRLLPRAIFIAAGYYMLCGLVVLTLRLPQAFSPWTMGTVFGVGQLLIATILYSTLERPAARGEPS